MQNILVKSPTRVDLAGGTLDLWPLFNFLGGAVTVNVAIDIWTRVEINPRSDKKVKIDSKDLSFVREYENLDEVLRSRDGELKLFQPLFEVFRPTQGFELITQSESPVGGGLGGSSSLMISLMKAFSIFSGKENLEVHQTVHIAHNLESQVLHTPTGTQDYYPAHSGGLNILKYGVRGIEQKVYSVTGSPLSENFLLVFTGRSHHSGLNNFEVLKAAIQKDKKTLESLQQLKEIAGETAEACLKKDWQALPGLFQREFESRVQLSPAFTSPEIEKLHDISLRAGAEAIKICGAGGGGCVLLWVSPSQRERVKEACQKAGFQTLNAKPVDLS